MGAVSVNEPNVPSLREGVVVAGRYRLLEGAGEGAMGTVWKAQHTTLGHAVAIKFLHGNVAASGDPRQRFEREAKLAARLGEASRHITRVSDHGVTDDGTPFIVMELLNGEGLDARLKREKVLPIGVVARITTQLCRALAIAHQAGVVHRDLKPANVFLCLDDDGDVLVKLLDFGVAKATLDNDENQQTRAGALIGTPNYMSPEQIAGDHAVDPRSDLWAVAAMVYRMCTGRAPFGSGALSELAMRIVSTEPRPATELIPELPHEFDLWVQRGLAKKPELRFQNARELADSLNMVAGVSATGATGVYSAFNAGQLALGQAGADSVGPLQNTLERTNPEGRTVSPTLDDPTSPRTHARSRNRVAMLVGAGLVALVVVGVGVATMSGRGDSRPRAVAHGPAAPKSPPKPIAPPPAPEPAASIDVLDLSDPPAPSASASAAHSAKIATAPVKAAPVAGGSPAIKAAPPTTKPTAAAPTGPAPDLKTQSGELWQKKDEM
ncbi:MAG: serine/threonine-protein kinase [Polyangiales bacterium]